MSNSSKAKERRQRRKKMSKHQRTIMGQQHWGDKTPSMEKQREERRRQEDIKLAQVLRLGALRRKTHDNKGGDK